MLRGVDYEADLLDSSCCGMAGSFGHETERDELSKAINQIAESSGGVITTPGASCRSQLGDRPSESAPPHPNVNKTGTE